MSIYSAAEPFAVINNSLEDANNCIELLEQAVITGSIAKVRQIMNHHNFAQITTANIGKAIRLGCEHNQLDIVESLLTSRQFAHISLHAGILDVGKALKYKCLDSIGMCRGIAMTGVQSALREDLMSFRKRLYHLVGLLYEHNGYAEDAVNILTATVHQEQLSVFCQECLAFFDGAEIWQSTDEMSYLFPTTIFPNFYLNAKVTEAVLSLLQANEQKREIDQVADWCGIGNRAELTHYFKELKKIFKASQTEKPIGIVLQANRHCIAIIYYPRENNWEMIDANYLRSNRISQENDLAITIFKALSHNLDQCDSFDRYLILSVDIFSRTEFSEQLKVQLEAAYSAGRLDCMHRVTEKKAQFQSPYQDKWLDDAIHKPDFLQIQSLIKEVGDVNQLLADGTPLALAVEHKNFKLVVELISNYHVNPNVLSNGEPPIAIALNLGDLETANFLIAHGSDLNVPYVSGETLLGRAATSGSLPRMTFLLAHGADPNMKSCGQSPLAIAQKNQHTHAVEFLLANGAVLEE